MSNTKIYIYIVWRVAILDLPQYKTCLGYFTRIRLIDISNVFIHSFGDLGDSLQCKFLMKMTEKSIKSEVCVQTFDWSCIYYFFTAALAAKQFWPTGTWAESDDFRLNETPSLQQCE